MRCSKDLLIQLAFPKTSEKETQMANVCGWYETENGAVLVDHSGNTVRSILAELHQADPENFGATDMELEDENGNSVAAQAARAYG